MEILEVRLLEPTDEGRIYYTPDPTIEPGILFITSQIDRPELFGINIEGGHVLFSLDKNRILMSVEFVYHRRGWKKTQLELPDPKSSKNIQMNNLNERHAEFDIPVIALTDNEYRYVQFRFYDFEGEGDWIALSEQCFALIVNGLLCGFFIKLNNPKS